jgi:TonB family protein
MISQHIDRSRSTGGGMTTSFVLHGGLLLLLALMAGRQAAIINEGGELAEIAYIEARYGEEVAAKVKLKEKPRMRPEPPGRGVNTDSAMKAPAEVSPEPIRPEPRAAKPTMKAPVRTESVQRPTAAKVDVATPAATVKVPPKALAEAPQLAVKAPRPKTRQVIDSSQLSGSLQNLKADEAVAPAANLANRTSETFAPQTKGLQNKSGNVALGQDVLTGASTSRGSAQIADAPAALASGGGLRSASSPSYQASGAALAPSGSRRTLADSKGITDVDGPGGTGGGRKSGRKTILNYGSGGSGSGGSLSGRQRIAEPVGNNEIVAQAAISEPAQKTVTDVKLDGKGVNMTITGQIQGRKVLESTAPVYSSMAKKKGWEGVVAVHFTVKADGHVKDNMYFDQTSVHRDLNQAAMAAIKQFVFAPLGTDQAAVEQWGVITIVFRLK